MNEQANPNQEVAARLRGLREGLDLSQEELARLTGYEASEVAAWESGETDIPVSYLYKVAQAGNMDLTAIISGDEGRLIRHSLVRKGGGLTVDRRSAYTYQSLAHRFHKPAMEPFLVTVDPKDEQDLHFASHEGEEFLYLLYGRLELRLGSQVVVMEEGDSLYFDSRTPHAMRGLNGERAVFLDVIN